jgi:hypothetical protein
VGRIARVAELGPRERRRMRELLAASFERVTIESFDRDLDEKEWAVILEDRSGEIRGFSTICVVAARAHTETMTAIYSGDTIVEREWRHDPALARAWSRHAFTIAASLGGGPVYWLLVCSGFRTYRFLPLFFKAFVPRAGCAGEDRLLRARHELATARFGARYDARRGIATLERPTPLRPGVGEITAERRRDPNIAFFERANPGPTLGDELVCLAALDEANLTRAGRRMLFGREAR